MKARPTGWFVPEAGMYLRSNLIASVVSAIVSPLLVAIFARVTARPTDWGLVEIAALVLSYVLWFRISLYLVARHRYRRWLGDWFYLTESTLTSTVKDGGFAWMRFFIEDGGLHYEVRRYETYDAMQQAVRVDRSSDGQPLVFLRRLLRSTRLRPADIRDVSAKSESIFFDRESGQLVIHYSAAYLDPTVPSRKGRLTLKAQGALAALGEYRSVVPESDGYRASVGRMYAARNMVNVAE